MFVCKKLGLLSEKIEKTYYIKVQWKIEKKFEKSINDFNESGKPNNKHEKKVTPKIIRPERKVHHNSIKFEKKEKAWQHQKIAG